MLLTYRHFLKNKFFVAQDTLKKYIFTENLKKLFWYEPYTFSQYF